MENVKNEAEVIKSIFGRSTAIIGLFLELGAGEALEQKSTCRRLAERPIEPQRFASLAGTLFEVLSNRRADREPSKENWRWSVQTKLDGNNKSAEVLLERAIAILAQHGHLPGWSNQIPVASGLVDQHQDKRAAIDLAKLEDGRLDLVELKWSSDTPVFAAFEIFLYGLAYVFCRAHKKEFGYSALETMRASHVTLNVLAPRKYYEGLDLLWLQEGLGAGLSAVAKTELEELMTTGFRFLAFPDGFEVPFINGRQVLDDCAADELPQRARTIVQAVNGIAPFYPAPTRA